MGKIKEIIQSADQTKEMTTETKETLNLLYELSKEKAEAFEAKIYSSLRTAGTTENPTIPITNILGSCQEVRVTTSNTPNTDVTENIATTLKSILTGSTDGIINGLTGLIDTALTVVLGAAKGEERQEHSYYISTDGLSIVRIDLMYWCRHITAGSITKYAEKSLVCTAVKSSVDLNKISFNSFLSSYQAQLKRCNFSNEEIFAEIKNAKEIFQLLKDPSDTNAPRVLRIAAEPTIQEPGVLTSCARPAAISLWPPC